MFLFEICLPSTIKITFLVALTYKFDITPNPRKPLCAQCSAARWPGEDGIAPWSTPSSLGLRPSSLADLAREGSMAGSSSYTHSLHGFSFRNLRASNASEMLKLQTLAAARGLPSRATVPGTAPIFFFPQPVALDRSSSRRVPSPCPSGLQAAGLEAPPPSPPSPGICKGSCVTKACLPVLRRTCGAHLRLILLVTQRRSVSAPSSRLCGSPSPSSQLILSP